MIGKKVHGAAQTKQKLEQVAEEIHGKPMVDAMRRAALLVVGTSKRLVGSDTGQLRASITPEVFDRGGSIVGVVGSNKVHAPYHELGTRPHWPPLKALEGWARRHGTSAYVVARAIARKGTKARKYLEGAVEQNRNRIHEIIGNAVKGIVDK